MAAHPLTDIVSNQYERWMYPQPILDLRSWLTNNWQWFDPSHAHAMFWPDRAYNPEMDILIAGCGTNQAAVFAYTNPQAKVVAIDVSQPSLDHHKFLKNKHSLKNLELYRLPIEEVGQLNRDFDLIVSTGVLHHLAVPEIGIKALSQCLRPDGVMAIMLYAKYGRIGVDMMQSVFRELGLQQNDTSVLMVKDALATLDQNHPVKSYTAFAPDLQFDAGLVDTFLHGRERSYTTAECIDLVSSADLVFQDIFLKSAYYPPSGSSRAFHAAIADLLPQQIWSIMERINIRNACHFFTACHPNRPKETYRIDFSMPEAPQFIPDLRFRCAINGGRISRYNWSMNLDAVQNAFVRQIDGRRTIAKIVEDVANRGLLPNINHDELTSNALALFKSLWQLDFLAMKRNTALA